ncbi:aldehyde dehydrogenase family protein [Nocardioides speluncae]|uniref:aldehyde dehydrogenase family protein n=1 Tax=Nocardioides speluncae TaxID=2670337 RepID=UPI001980BB92|nr:aldehyde dehydrogenase family protein [Nocardioides speluncae]
MTALQTGDRLVSVEPDVIDWLKMPRPMIIDGEQVGSDRSLDVEDPATGRRIGSVALAGPELVQRAVAAARATFDDGGWRWMSSAARSRLILAAASLIDRHTEELAQLDALDGGVPIEYGRASIAEAVLTLEYAAGITARITGQTVAPANHRGDLFQAQVIREPLGVVAQIVPWNLPFGMAVEKVALGLATANTMVLKPAEQTPLSALRLGELLLEAGIPPGVVNVVSGFGAETGDALVRDPRVNKVSFTGSTVTGKAIVVAASANLTPVSLELGGKSPFIVLGDADLDEAASAAAENIFTLSGQACTAPSRMFVQHQAHDEFVERLSAAAGRVVVGSPLDPRTTAGPLVSEVQRRRVARYVDGALEDGATLACGGAPGEGAGYYYAPTVLTDTTPRMTINREEVFGPVVTVTPFDTVDEVIALANDTSYGLAAGVWTNDLAASQRLVRELQAGSVWVNTYNLFDPALPFGGYKQSGWGRETGMAAVELYTQTKTVAAATTERTSP